MKLAMLLISSLAVAFGQGGAGFGRVNGVAPPGRSLGGAGFGRILFPGTGAPAAVRNTGPRGGFGFIPQPPPAPHPTGHGRTVIVPYPVYYGGDYYPYDAPPAVQAGPDYEQYAQQSPLVIMNQSFRPDTANPVLRDYSSVPLPEPAPRTADGPRPVLSNYTNDDSPTIYLIAMKDRTIFAAIAYWMDGETLNYVTRDANINHASLELVDRELSRQLNQDRNVEFKLPPAK
jgi:hypothetical protein